MMNEKQFNTITEWQNDTFPDSTVKSRIAHLREELDELEGSINQKLPMRFQSTELADCFILLMGIAAKMGFTHYELESTIRQKHDINLNREWGEPKANGVVNHVGHQPLKATQTLAEMYSDNSLITDRLYLQEIINDLERNGYVKHGKAHVMLRDWSREMRDRSGLRGKTKKAFRKLIGIANY